MDLGLFRMFSAGLGDSTRAVTALEYRNLENAKSPLFRIYMPFRIIYMANLILTGAWNGFLVPSGGLSGMAELISMPRLTLPSRTNYILSARP
jgi:hypothetical protein